LEQNYVKDSNKTVKEHLLQVSGKLGEAMSIRRFVRFQLGEEL
jgi:translation elongation factor EF-Ts